MQDSDGSRTAYAYDAVGRLAALWAPNGDTVGFTYDPGGRLTEKTFPNGVSTRYTYDVDNTLLQVRTQAGSTVLTEHVYSYTGAGLRQAHTETIGGTTTPYKYVYDELGRLLEVRNNSTNALIEGYTYDPLGNRLSKTDGTTTWTHVHDAGHQLTEIWSGGIQQTALSYDLTGNLTTRTELGSGTTTGFAYDALNQMVWMGTGTTPPVTFAYDAQGRRLRKTLGVSTTHYLYT